MIALLGIPNEVFIVMGLTLMVSVILLGVMFVAMRSSQIQRRADEERRDDE